MPTPFNTNLVGMEVDVIQGLHPIRCKIVAVWLGARGVVQIAAAETGSGTFWQSSIMDFRLVVSGQQAEPTLTPEEVDLALRQNRPIQAIASVRSRAGCDLRTARNAVYRVTGHPIPGK